MNSDYSKVDFIKNTWPKWVPSPRGGWQREWSLEFEHDVDIYSTAGLSDYELEATAELGPTKRDITLTTRTTLDPMSDEIFFTAAFRLFLRIEERCGRLKSIQGQPRELWRPFR
jgi:hypothetical protein